MSGYRAIGSRKILTFAIVALLAHTVVGEIWEFGVANIPGSIVVAYEKGSMGLFQHLREIKLTVPDCFVLTYVKVKVINLISSPNVLYDALMNVVIIKYKPFQNSVSSFEIVGKAVWQQNCLVSPTNPQYD